MSIVLNGVLMMVGVLVVLVNEGVPAAVCVGVVVVGGGYGGGFRGGGGSGVSLLEIVMVG